MAAKLTLTLKDQVIQKAKVNRKSASTPITQSLMGSYKAPKEFNYKKVLSDEKLRKHK